MYSKFIKKQPTEMKQSLEKNAFETKNQWEYEKKPKVLEVAVAYTQCICMHGAANMWLKHKNSQQKHEKIATQQIWWMRFLCLISNFFLIFHAFSRYQAHKWICTNTMVIANALHYKHSARPILLHICTRHIQIHANHLNGIYTYIFLDKVPCV